MIRDIYDGKQKCVYCLEIIENNSNYHTYCHKEMDKFQREQTKNSALINEKVYSQGIIYLAENLLNLEYISLKVTDLDPLLIKWLW